MQARAGPACSTWRIRAILVCSRSLICPNPAVPSRKLQHGMLQDSLFAPDLSAVLQDSPAHACSNSNYPTLVALAQHTTHLPGPHPLQLSCHNGPSTACPATTPAPAILPRQPACGMPWNPYEPTSVPAPACLPKPPGTCSLQREQPYTRLLLQDQKRSLSHLIHRNKHRKTNKMRRQRNKLQTKEQDKIQGGGTLIKWRKVIYLIKS